MTGRAKLRKFRVWVRAPYAGVPETGHEVEVPDECTTPAEVEALLREELEELVWGYVESGWEECE